MDKKEISERIKNILVEDLFVADSASEIEDEAELGTDLGMGLGRLRRARHHRRRDL